MTTVAALAKGSYSTYEVICLFEDPADAERVAAELNGPGPFSEFYVQQLPVMPAGHTPGRVTVYSATVTSAAVDGRTELKAYEYRQAWEWERRAGIAVEELPGAVQPEYPNLNAIVHRAELAVFRGTDQDLVLQAAQVRLGEYRAALGLGGVG